MCVCMCHCVCIFVCDFRTKMDNWIMGLLDLFVLRIIDPSSLIRSHDLGISREERRKQVNPQMDARR